MKTQQQTKLLLAMLVAMASTMPINVRAEMSDPSKADAANKIAPSEQIKEPTGEPVPDLTKIPQSVATISQIQLKGTSIIASVQWAKDVPLPKSAAIETSSSLDAKRAIKSEVTPKAGATTDIVLAKAIEDPQKTGWSRVLVLKDDAGKTITSQPYNIGLDCKTPAKGKTECVYKVSLGVGASEGVIQVSVDLDQAIDEMEQKMPKGGLVEYVRAKYPDLLGEAIVYSDQLARLNAVKPVKENCKCIWMLVIPSRVTNPVASWIGDRTNASGSNSGPAHTLNANSWPHWTGWYRGSGHASTSGSSEITLKIRCQKFIAHYVEEILVVPPLPATPYVLKYEWDEYAPCSLNCDVKFEHKLRYTGYTYESTENGSDSYRAEAIVTETGNYLINGALIGNAGLNNTNPNQGGRAFDKIWATSTAGLTSIVPTGSSGAAYRYSTANLSTYGFVKTLARNDSSDAQVRNGFVMLMLAQAPCMTPNKALTWDIGSYQGNYASLRDTGNAFFAGWNIPPVIQ